MYFNLGSYVKKKKKTKCEYVQSCESFKCGVGTCMGMSVLHTKDKIQKLCLGVLYLP